MATEIDGAPLRGIGPHGPPGGQQRGWSRAFTAVMLLGVVCGVVHWGWRVPVAAAITVAGGAAYVRFVSWVRGRDGSIDLRVLAGDCLQAGVVVVAVAGLFATSAPLALVAVLGLLVTAPWARRVARELVMVRRWSREASRGLRWPGDWGRDDVSGS